MGIWCLNKNTNKIYGLKLIYYFLNNSKYKYIGGIGLTKNIIQLYKKLNFKVGEMKHYYILNNTVKKTVISKNLIKNNFLSERNFKIKENKSIVNQYLIIKLFHLKTIIILNIDTKNTLYINIVS